MRLGSKVLRLSLLFTSGLASIIQEGDECYYVGRLATYLGLIDHNTSLSDISGCSLGWDQRLIIEPKLNSLHEYELTSSLQDFDLGESQIGQSLIYAGLAMQKIGQRPRAKLNINGNKYLLSGGVMKLTADPYSPYLLESFIYDLDNRMYTLLEEGLRGDLNYNLVFTEEKLFKDHCISREEPYLPLENHFGKIEYLFLIYRHVEELSSTVEIQRLNLESLKDLGKQSRPSTAQDKQDFPKEMSPKISSQSAHLSPIPNSIEDSIALYKAFDAARAELIQVGKLDFEAILGHAANLVRCIQMILTVDPNYAFDKHTNAHLNTILSHLASKPARIDIISQVVLGHAALLLEESIRADEKNSAMYAIAYLRALQQIDNEPIQKRLLIDIDDQFNLAFLLPGLLPTNLDTKQLVLVPELALYTRLRRFIPIGSKKPVKLQLFSHIGRKGSLTFFHFEGSSLSITNFDSKSEKKVLTFPIDKGNELDFHVSTGVLFYQVIPTQG